LEYIILLDETYILTQDDMEYIILLDETYILTQDEMNEFGWQIIKLRKVRKNRGWIDG